MIKDMIKAMSIIVCSLLLSCTPFISSQSWLSSEDSSKNMDRMSRMSVKIEYVCDMESKGRMGSGVVVKRSKGSTLVATANHVTDYIVEEGCDIVVVDYAGLSGFGEVIAYDSDTDVSVVAVNEVLGKPSRLFDKPYLGMPVTCVGWPSLPYRDYEGQSITRGYISTLDVNGFIRISADIYYGNSGGPCFSNDGRVAGVISHFMAGGYMAGEMMPAPGQSFISHVDNLKDLLKTLP